uniref:Putative ABC transporter, permease protein n=1 Tax=alpha proteobacterium NT18-17 TaxID=1778876 RepID=A0A140D6N8_9PROT|nr:putative ABC transporter, permease protein [alpha proteobacterium NT18-17]
MKAFIALVQRELIEHRGAFLIGPLLLVAVLFGATVLAFTVGRVDARFSGAIFTVAPLRVFEVGFLGFGVGWSLYLISVLFFYCADGFAADKRNNAMLFWKSMPVSDFRMLLTKLVAALTILPGTVYAVALLSGVLLFGVAYVTMLINGTGTAATLGSIVVIYGHAALAILVVLVCGLLWYLPAMALVGAMATAVGRWAIPISLLLPALLSTLEWVTLGGLHPFATHIWRFIEYRGALPDTPYVDTWLTSSAPFSGVEFATDLITRMDWTQVGIGVVFSLVALFVASEYRRRSNDN